MNTSLCVPQEDLINQCMLYAKKPDESGQKLTVAAVKAIVPALKAVVPALQQGVAAVDNFLVRLLIGRWHHNVSLSSAVHPHAEALNALHGKIYLREVYHEVKLPLFRPSLSGTSQNLSWEWESEKIEEGKVKKLNKRGPTKVGLGRETHFDKMKFKGEISEPNQVTLDQKVCSALGIPFYSAVSFFYPDPDLSKSMLDVQTEDREHRREHLNETALQKQALIRHWLADDDKGSGNPALAMLLLLGGFVYFEFRAEEKPKWQPARIKAIINGIEQEEDAQGTLSIGKWELLPLKADDNDDSKSQSLNPAFRLKAGSLKAESLKADKLKAQSVGFSKMRENKFDKFAWVIVALID